MRRPVKISRGYPIPRPGGGPGGCMRPAAGRCGLPGWRTGRREFCFTGEMHPKDRSRLAFIMRYAVRHPERIVPHARRLARDLVLRLRFGIT